MLFLFSISVFLWGIFTFQMLISFLVHCLSKVLGSFGFTSLHCKNSTFHTVSDASNSSILTSCTFQLRLFCSPYHIHLIFGTGKTWWRIRLKNKSVRHMRTTLLASSIDFRMRQRSKFQYYFKQFILEKAKVVKVFKLILNTINSNFSTLQNYNLTIHQCDYHAIFFSNKCAYIIFKINVHG